MLVLPLSRFTRSTHRAAAQLLQRMTLLLLLAFGHATLAQPDLQSEYTLVGYDEPPAHNRVARLIAKMASGEVTLEYQGHRGYLGSLLAALEIDPHSQLLVFSKTSLQYSLINFERPRAVYFNEDTYIGWVQHSTIVEVTTIDDKLGTVFYTFDNIEHQPKVNQEPQRCIVCHDSTGATGGGIPTVMARSSIYSANDFSLRNLTGDGNVTDKTPLRDRWGGWFVSGKHGSQTHLGNLQLQSEADLPRVDELRRGNLATLDSLFDTSPYLTPTSDIVALMVLEHQLTVQNQLTYVKFKAPAVLLRTKLDTANSAQTWAELPERGQHALTRMFDELLRLLLQKNAIALEAPIEGLPQFQTAFLNHGPRDSTGRSLRELDLQTRLFRHSLSYLIYSDAFDAIPLYGKDYIYRRLAAIVQGRDDSEDFEWLTAAQRSDLLAILRDTKPDFVPYIVGTTVR